MMINIKRVLLFVVVIVCFFTNQNIFAQKTNAFDANGNRDGLWEKYYENGQPRYIGNFKHGKEIGVFKFFSITNENHPTSIKIFSETSNIAKVQYFTSDGKLQSKGQMIGKKRIGCWEYYFSNGKLLSEENYVDGKLNGKLINYYQNGKKTEEIPYKNGLKNGVSKKYSDQGVLIELITYKKNKANGLAKFFDLKGNLKETGNYKNGKRVGKWKYYIEGKVVSKKKKEIFSIPKHKYN
ncbi:toxin-antitoxin system YwqK family antitoxin [Tenacibaculum sp. UWU-22]|uniref:toxin-antitoxin system YwqK family antitoxin n=1 Tax=Tenacibaculum sp. UWU-22 TaxID=3234187 RepID=UPI0034DABB39